MILFLNVNANNEISLEKVKEKMLDKKLKSSVQFYKCNKIANASTFAGIKFAFHERALHFSTFWFFVIQNLFVVDVVVVSGVQRQKKNTTNTSLATFTFAWIFLFAEIEVFPPTADVKNVEQRGTFLVFHFRFFFFSVLFSPDC